MKLSREKIKELLSGAGEGARLRDLGFAILCLAIEDPLIAYRIIYNQTEPSGSKEEQKMLKDAKIESLMKSVGEIIFPTSAAGGKKRGKNDELDQDEIRERLMRELSVLTDIRDNKSDELDAKDYASISGRIADILVKLKDKFGAVDKARDQRIVVLHKYNDICPYCHREIEINREG